MNQFLTDLLDSSHIRDDFECEEPSLVEYLQKQSNQDKKKSLSLCFVARAKESAVIGYYTLSNYSIKAETLPSKWRLPIPKSYIEVPVTLLERLARRIDFKGTELGKDLIMDALHRSYVTSTVSVASMGIVLDPMNKRVKQIYADLGFVELVDSDKMFISMKTIKTLFAQ